MAVTGPVAVKITEDPLFNALVDRYNQLRSVRARWEDHWRVLRELVRPMSPEFTSGPATKRGEIGERRHDEIFDSTAPFSVELLASGMMSFTMPSSERWFNLGLVGVPVTRLNRTQKTVLERRSDILYSVFKNPRAGFQTAMHENMLDLFVFGTSVTFEQWIPQLGHNLYRTYPLADCFIDVNQWGKPDTIYRDTRMTKRQIMLQWPKAELGETVLKAKPTDTFTVVHATQPKDEVGFEKQSPRRFPWASFYFILEDGKVVEQSGFESFPYMVARWSKIAGEIYGRSPTMSVLPDIQMINRMVKEMIVAAQLSNRPPIVLDDDGFMLPISYRPGALIFKERGTEFPQPLNSGIQPNITFEMMSQSREMIRQAFLINFLQLELKKERQTVLETADRRDEGLRMISPLIERMQVELVGPVIDRTSVSLEAKNLLPELPGGMKNSEIIYNSPAARAQLSNQIIEMQQFIQDLIPLANIDPSALVVLDIDDYAERLATLRRVPPSLLRDDEEKQAIRAAQQEQADVQQATEAAPAAATVIKDLATANEKGGLG